MFKGFLKLGLHEYTFYFIPFNFRSFEEFVGSKKFPFVRKAVIKNIDWKMEKIKSDVKQGKKQQWVKKTAYHHL